MSRTTNPDPNASLEMGAVFTGKTHKPEEMMRDATLRDYFAAAALPTVIALYNSQQHQGSSRATEDKYAAWAYRWADAMIAAREPKKDSE